MKKYEAYKDSGVEWIGEIPEHWSRLRIKNIVSIKVTDGPHETPEWKVEGIPFISAEAIRGNIIDLNYKRGNISKEQHDEYSKKSKVVIGDILFCKSGSTTGKSAMVLTDEDFGIWSPLAIIRADKSKINNVFLYQSIQSGWFRRQVETSWTFGTQPNIGMGALENLWVTMPPIKEQVTIARYLDHKTSKIDTLITKKEKLIELLQEERTSIINHTVIKGLDANVPMKDSGIEWLGEIPEHWELKKIKHVNKKIGSGVTPKGGGEVYQDSGIPLLRSQNVYFDGFRLEDVAYISEEIHKSMSGSKVYPSDVLLNITGGSIGRCYYVTDEFQEANVNQHVCIVRPNSKIETVYLYNLLRSHVGQLQIDICQSGGNRESLNFEQLKNFSIPLPSIDEQREILWLIEKREAEINTIISKTQQEIELLKEYKIALISEVVTGKVDVQNEILN